MSDPNFAVGPHAVCVRQIARLEFSNARYRDALEKIVKIGCPTEINDTDNLRMQMNSPVILELKNIAQDALTKLRDGAHDEIGGGE